MPEVKNEKWEESHPKQSETELRSRESIICVIFLRQMIFRLLGFCFDFEYQLLQN